MGLQFLRVFFANLNAVVHQAPPEVVNIQVMISSLIDCLEDSCQLSDSEARSIVESLLQILHSLVDIKLCQNVNWSCVGSIRSSCDHKQVLLLLELGWHING